MSYHTPKILRKQFFSLNLEEVCTLWVFSFCNCFILFLTQALQNIGAILRGAGLDYSSGNWFCCLPVFICTTSGRTSIPNFFIAWKWIDYRQVTKTFLGLIPISLWQFPILASLLVILMYKKHFMNIMELIA